MGTIRIVIIVPGIIGAIIGAVMVVVAENISFIEIPVI